MRASNKGRRTVLKGAEQVFFGVRGVIGGIIAERRGTIEPIVSRCFERRFKSRRVRFFRGEGGFVGARSYSSEVLWGIAV
ncbi:MAG: hypothetical protein JSW23_10045 [Planctomycetota bacterium]|nr:MAG: hypothetical protein JSW23_10045 [Planctomycetota bacterium]